MQEKTTPTVSSLGRIDRRTFVGGAVAAVAAAATPGQSLFAQSAERVTAAKKGPELCAFIKFVQSLSYDDMAKSIAEIGFDGIESTVRAKGHVLPERVEEDLPRQLEAVKKQGMDITIMTTDVLRADDPLTEKVLRTGASLGLKKYRMGFYRYDPKRGVIDQLNELRPIVKDLAALNKELGMTAVYQNHSGVKFVGAPIWDLHYLFEGIPTEQIGVAFDIRHAMIEGGLAWPLHYDLMKPRIGALFAKDYQWAGSKAEHAPLGTGRVDKKFYKMHMKSGIDCPVSLHVEYLKKGDAQENLAAIRRDFAVLNQWLDQ